MRKRLVYFLDDEKFILVIAQKMLVAHNYEVEIFSSSSEFFDALARRKPDAVIVDYMMPDYDGASIIEGIRKLEGMGDLPTLVYSAADIPILNELIKKTGATGYIPKGVKMTDFVARMEKLLGWEKG